MNDIKDKGFIFGSIFTLSNKLQVLGDKFDRNLTVKQWLLLAGIYKSRNEMPTISEVAGIIGNSRQNVKKMVLILEKEGFVAIENDSNDARVQKIMLTKKCLDYMLQREKKELEFLEHLFEGFEPTELQEMVRSISKLEKNIIGMARLYHHEEKE
ncbi:MarR family winged helix-turn-helix transcriptional regulator [Paenibacillus donghaensis]|uniref:MarR family transcriptional regulator n=1 Tax=Paenibacillus donghaensis TaxID=414771 RepID=A0A2Z2KG79_9BACL|nr:MarR family winged helix-turn-helix transcriptional regulator [Paenibacillus donghaensis]ASA25756.1 MarR family transcriptional regulator [Paenibacillus donghaensis]